jgi:hypothetical protein
MTKYRIAWLPGDGIGMEVLEADDVASKTQGSSPPPSQLPVVISLKQQHERYTD